MYDGLHRYELFEFGWAMNAAMNDPKQLKKLIPAQEIAIPLAGPLKPSPSVEEPVNG